MQRTTRFKPGDWVKVMGYGFANGLIVKCNPELEELRYMVKDLDRPASVGLWLLADRHLEPWPTLLEGIWSTVKRVTFR